MSLCINDNKLLEKCKTIWTNTEHLKNIKLDALPVFNYRYIKAKIRTYGDKAYTHFRDLDVPEDCIECESLTVNSMVIYLFMTTNIIFKCILKHAIDRLSWWQSFWFWWKLFLD